MKRVMQIVTPEGITFSMQLAGPIRRFLALFIDFGVIGIMTSVFSTLIHFIAVITPDLARAGSIVSYFVISIGYSMIFEWKLKGQTLGKRLLRIRVVDAQGLNLQMNQVIIRNLLRFVDSFPMLYAAGGIAMFSSTKNQRLGDLVANTVVIEISSETVMDTRSMKPVKFNSFSEYPHLEARLRKLTEAGELVLAIQALTRREELDSDSRVELFKEMRQHFSKKVTFPEETTRTMSDEVYIRNVVDSIISDQRHLALDC